jgi:ATP/maltotriose-dependent transcriptional regulator MalT
VGREAELGTLGQALETLAERRAVLLELSGEPGIGKSRLLAELAERSDAQGHLVLTGVGSELERDVPFWVFADALDEYVQALEPRRLAGLDDAVRAELATVLPSLGGAAATGQAERYRAHRAVRELLELLAAAKPLVLVLDDLHWADDASVELLGALLRRPPDAAVLLAAASRPRQRPQPLATALDRALREGGLLRIELGALAQPDALALLGEGVDVATAATLYEESGGNPFYLEQIARAPAATSVAELSLDGVRVPPMVAAALSEELALLSTPARTLLDGAAVAGEPFDPELAAAVGAVDDAAALDALDELLGLDLVRATAVPRRFRFRHPLVRRAVYEGTRGGWRLGAHERAAGQLAARGAPVASRAHHLERCAREGDATAVAALREAGEASAQRSPAIAARWFAAALRVQAPAAPASERVGLQLALAEALTGAGRFADAHATLLEALAIAPHGADPLRMRVVTALAAVEHLLGRHADGQARLRAALDALPDDRSELAAGLQIELAVGSMFEASYDAMRDWAARAGEAADALDAPELHAAALALRALGSSLSADIEQSRRHREAAAELVDRLGDDVLARQLGALVHLATAEMYLDQFEACGRHAGRALTVGRATGQTDQFPLIMPMFGTTLWLQGRTAEACEVLDGAVEGARLIDNVQGIAWNLFNLSFAALAGGDLELALSSAEESLRLARELDSAMLIGHAAWAAAAPMLERGDAAGAAELMLRETGGEELSAIPGGWRTVALELLTRALLAAGRREEARRASANAAACAAAVGLPMAASMAGLCEAALRMDEGDAAGAVEPALDAAARLEEVGNGYYAAIARLRAGRALRQAGDADGARTQLHRAAASFDAFGSGRQRAEAEQELRRLGERIQRRTRSAGGDGVGSLTARELEIALLVVDRRTNAEIADELFLSIKTVESHLRNVFHKLGVSSRVEAARVVEAASA